MQKKKGEAALPQKHDSCKGAFFSFQVWTKSFGRIAASTRVHTPTWFNEGDQNMFSRATSSKREILDEEGGKDEEPKWPAPSSWRSASNVLFFKTENFCQVISIWFYAVIRIGIHPVSKGLWLNLSLVSPVQSLPRLCIAIPTTHLMYVAHPVTLCTHLLYVAQPCT